MVSERLQWQSLTKAVRALKKRHIVIVCLEGTAKLERKIKWMTVQGDAAGNYCGEDRAALFRAHTWRLATSPVMALPDLSKKRFMMRADATVDAMGAVPCCFPLHAAQNTTGCHCAT